VVFLLSCYACIKNHSALRVIITCLLALLGGITSLQVYGAAEESVDSGWFYHWGDLPKKSGTADWDVAAGNWQVTDTASSVPGRQGEKILWLKVNLPDRSWHDPHLFISSVDLTLQVFHADKLIYQFGVIDDEGNSRFQGWPWHIIRLPVDYSKQAFYFRVFSDYSDIGLSGDVIIGERFELLSKVYKQGFTGLLFIVVLVVVGIISTVIGAIKRDGYVAVSTGLLSLDLALMMFAENELSQLLWLSPLSWRYLAAVCYFLVPAFLAIVVQSWHREKSRTSRLVLITSLLFVVAVSLLAVFSSFNLIFAYPYFDLLFVIMVLSLLASCLRKLPRQGLRGLLMSLGVFALFVSLLLDMMSAHGVIDWIGRMGQWGLITFALTSLSIYLLKDWQQQKELHKLTQHLETEVQARTQELKLSQIKLQQMAREDFLTSLLNRRAFSEQAITELSSAIRQQRPLSLLLFDIDHFKDINDCYGHSTGDRVLKAVASVTKHTCRESDLVCRYGGEEFVVLLHATDSTQAHTLAARLREAINNIAVESGSGETISITASFGLVCADRLGDVKQPAGELLERLLRAADQVMYEVKTAGRDAVKVHNLDVIKTIDQLALI